MRVKTLTVHWHDECQPIFSADFQSYVEEGELSPADYSPRLATAGGDSAVRLWRVGVGENLGKVDYLSTLSSHTQAVNVVRFSPTSNMLASGGDDGVLNLWAPTRQPKATGDSASAGADSNLMTTSEPVGRLGDDNDDKENWRVKTVCRSNSTDIYDIAWSPDGSLIMAGSMDNVVRIFCTRSGQCLCQLTDHGHYVQGVAWDPLSRYLASLSSDRSLCVYSHQKETQYKLEQRMVRADIPLMRESDTESALGSSSSDSAKSVAENDPGRVATDVSRSDENKGCEPALSKAAMAIFHNEKFPSFFRRLSFSPDGSFLLAPAGMVRTDGGSPDDCRNMVFVFSRADLCGPPVFGLPGTQRASLAVRFSPILYKLREGNQIFDIPYRMVYAVAMPDTVILYDTERREPLALLSSLHYSTFTDLAWSPDGRSLTMSSSDGFCSVVEFEKGDLGEKYEGDPIEYKDIGATISQTAQKSSLAAKLATAQAKADHEQNGESPPAMAAQAPAVNWLQAKRKPKPKPASVETQVPKNTDSEPK